MEKPIPYRRPARLDDELLLLSEVEEVRAASCLIHHRVMRADELIVDAKITAAFLDAGGRPCRQPQPWVEIFRRLMKEKMK